MKTLRINQLARLTIAIAAFAGTSGIVTAGENATTGKTVTRVIQLPASNNGLQTITIQAPVTVSRPAQPAAAAHNTPKTVELPQVNIGTQRSITVWIPSEDRRSEVAPVK